MFFARYWRVLAIAAAVAAVLVLITRCTDQAEQRGYNRATTEMQRKIIAANQAVEQREAEQREISAQIDRQHQEQARALQDRIADLSARNLDLGRLRVRPACPAARAADPAATTIVDGAAGERGHVVPPAADPERELGVELLQYGGECERYRQQLTDLQGWVDATLQNRLSVNQL